MNKYFIICNESSSHPKYYLSDDLEDFFNIIESGGSPRSLTKYSFNKKSANFLFSYWSDVTKPLNITIYGTNSKDKSIIKKFLNK